MSRQVRLVEVCPPREKAQRELVVVKGHVCGYCGGRGFLDGTRDMRDETTICPICRGEGEVDALVSIEWVPSKRLEY